MNLRPRRKEPLSATAPGAPEASSSHLIFDGEGARLSALLASPGVNQLLEEQAERLLEEREAHADAIRRIADEQSAKLPDFDTRLATQMAKIVELGESLANAKAEWLALDSEKRTFLNSTNFARNMHEKELRRTAPLIDDFLAELYALAGKYQNLAPSEQLVEARQNNQGTVRREVYYTDAESALSWQSDLTEIIRAAEALKLNPDFRRFPDRIAKLRSLVADPGKFEMKVKTVDRELARPRILPW